MIPNSDRDIRSFISDWNRSCPIDKWWREKHNISFNSSIHRSASFIDMYIEFWEYRLFDRKEDSKDIKEEDRYIKGRGNFLNKQKLSEKASIELFDELDIDNLNFSKK